MVEKVRLESQSQVRSDTGQQVDEDSRQVHEGEKRRRGHEEIDLNDENQVTRLGMRFRDTVLALGGGRHPGKVFEDFRGRSPSTAALLRHSGLA